jgi:ribosomal protein S18 acetylase RimI-like enzyme
MEPPDRPACGGRLESLLAQPFGDLQPLWAEEAEVLWRTLHWQVEPWKGPMGGLAWVGDGKVLGCLPLCVRGPTAMLGRLFASRWGPTEGVEAGLLSAALHGVFSDPRIQRVSGEFLGAAPRTLEWLVSLWPGQVQPRLLMEVAWTGAGETRTGSSLEPWQGEHLIPAAGLLRRAHGEGPRVFFDPVLEDDGETARLLERIITCPLCGTFEPGASFAARAPESGDLLGFILATRMGTDRGHVAEVAVDPAAQGRGIGKTLITRALEALRGLGCRATHLAVDGDNRKVIRLYRSLGFREYHRFPALRLIRGGEIHSSRGSSGGVQD